MSFDGGSNSNLFWVNVPGPHMVFAGSFLSNSMTAGAHAHTWLTAAYRVKAPVKLCTEEPLPKNASQVAYPSLQFTLSEIQWELLAPRLAGAARPLWRAAGA